MSDEPKPRLFSPGVGKRGINELHFAAYCGDLPGLLYWLEEGFDPNLTDNYRGYAALHWVADMAGAGGPRVEMLHALAKHGADLNMKSSVTNETALDLAYAAGSLAGDNLIDALLKLGANP